MTNSLEHFWQLFNQKKITEALELFNKLELATQHSIFANLFQRAQYQNQPQVISVLYRKLHQDKNFNDFHQAWLPPADATHPVDEAGVHYLQSFSTPTRVINAVNAADPKEILSIGLHWVDEEQAKALWEGSAQTTTNERRNASISEVADRVSAEMYWVESDDNLGTPF